MVTNNSCDYSPTQYNVQSGGASGTLNDIAPLTAGYVLTSNGASAQPTFQIPPLNGTLIYYLTNTASSVASNLQLTATPYTPKTTISFVAVTNGQNLQDWITNAGVPNLSFIPAGVFAFHIHALQVATAGHRTAQLYCEVWEASSVGADIAKIGTTETTPVLTTSEIEYNVAFVTSTPYTMGSTASRVKIKLFVTVVGASTAPDVNIFVGGTADSFISLPSQTVDATNFVPYTGATTNVDLGSKTLKTSGGIIYGTGSTMQTYTRQTSWTPTLRGGTIAGTPSYVFQFGFYTELDDIIFATFNVFGSLTGSTGVYQIGGFPFAANGTANYNAQGVVWTSLPSPAGTVSVSLALLGGTTTAQILSLGGNVYYPTSNGSNVNTIGTIWYYK